MYKRQVLRGVRAAQAAGFERIKLNAVILKNRNHDEVVDLARFAIDSGLDISFIEEMPLGVIGDHDRAEAHYSSDAIRADLARAFALAPTTETVSYTHLDVYKRQTLRWPGPSLLAEAPLSPLSHWKM